MATNYSLKELAVIVSEGADLLQIQDIGKRFPLLLNLVAKISAQTGNEFLELMNYLPDTVTATKVNGAIKRTLSGEDADVEEEENVPEKASKAPSKGKDSKEKVAESTDEKPAPKKRGRPKKVVVEPEPEPAPEVVEIEEVEPVEDAEFEVEEEVEASNPYDGKPAMELYEECKNRGIPAKAKKNANFYIDLLIEDDKEAESDTIEDEDDDWDV
ncbi:MAG: hypothetical protein ACRCZQ_08155 [Bacteroidales bacterium]